MLARSLALALLLLCANAPAAEEPAAQLADRMLAALGGRDAWARAKEHGERLAPGLGWRSVRAARRDHDGIRQPRLKIETRGKDLHLIRVLDGDRSWRMSRDGSIGPLNPEVVTIDRRFWDGHVYRTLHRIAARDPALALASARKGASRCTRAGERIAWYALDRAGQPYLYGAHDDEVGGIFGPWEHQVAGIRHPAWVTREGGKWRAMLKRLEVNVPLDDAVFARPAAKAG
jgi:hypothetical protein